MKRIAPTSSFSFRTFGTRYQYLGGLRPELEKLHPHESWHLDWERLSRPGNLDVQFHPFFDIAEVLAYHRNLTSLDAHLYDAGHFMLETHAAEVAPLLVGFVGDVLDHGAVRS